MKKRFLVVPAILFASLSFAQKKEPPPPPPPPPPKVDKFLPAPPAPPKASKEQRRFPPPVVYPDRVPDDYKAFLKRNPTVKGIGWMNGNKVRIHLKSGKDEVYNLQNEKEASNLKNKYGELPVPPPPPPPMAPKAPKVKSES